MRDTAFPLREQIKIIARKWINNGLDLLRAPFRRAEVLLVKGDARPPKALEVELRLRFLLNHLEKDVELRRVDRAPLWACIRSCGVAAADATAVSSFARRRLRWVVDLDYETNPFDAWALVDLGAAITHSPSRMTLAAAHQTFVDHVRMLKADGPKPVYLFGTGPSLRLAADRSFEDGIAIVCNTIVRDQELWHHLTPAFLAAGDAIYHFGHNPHARAFRADALQRLKESNGQTLFVYPYQFDVIVRPEFKEVQSLLVPIPRGMHTDVTVNLTERFSIPPLGNVLCDELLPLGCTLSTDVRLWGFDGRAPDDKGFWSNSPLQSYPELMQSMRDSHPAFFADVVPEGKEVEYVELVHGDRLDERLTEAEKRGFNFRMLHPTWTATLQKRYSD